MGSTGIALVWVRSFGSFRIAIQSYSHGHQLDRVRVREDAGHGLTGLRDRPRTSVPMLAAGRIVHFPTGPSVRFPERPTYVRGDEYVGNAKTHFLRYDCDDKDVLLSAEWREFGLGSGSDPGRLLETFDASTVPAAEILHDVSNDSRVGVWLCRDRSFVWNSVDGQPKLVRLRTLVRGTTVLQLWASRLVPNVDVLLGSSDREFGEEFFSSIQFSQL